MRVNNFEIRKNTGNKQYDEILYPKTIASNIICNSKITLEDEIYNALNVMKHTTTSSSTCYIVDVESINEITINNPNYIHLDSKLEVYYNGLLMFEDMHYKIVGNNIISLIDFNATLNDEFNFRVYNNFKPNINFEYTSLPSEYKESMEKLMFAINDYIGDVNSFKSSIITYLNNLEVNISMENSFNEVLKALSTKLMKRDFIPRDLGLVTATKPYFEYDISFNLGRLYGELNDVIYFENNNLGDLAFKYKKHIATNEGEVITTDKNNPIRVNELEEERS